MLMGEVDPRPQEQQWCHLNFFLVQAVVTEQLGSPL